MERAGQSLGMDRSCGAAPAKRKEGRALGGGPVPQEGSSVEGPRRWRDCTDRIQVEEDQQKERRRKGPQEGGQSGRTAPVARLL